MRTRAEKFAYEFESDARVEWVKSLPCCACSRVPCDNHHVIGEGMGRRGKSTWIVPLCSGPDGCHQRLHRIGKLSFLQQNMLWFVNHLGTRESYEQLEDLAAAVEARWRRETDGLSD